MNQILRTICIAAMLHGGLMSLAGCQHTSTQVSDVGRANYPCTSCEDSDGCDQFASGCRSDGLYSQCQHRGRPHDGGRLSRCIYGERGCDFCKGDIPVKPGTYLNQIHQAEIAIAKRDQFTISEHEWYQGQDQLGPEGRRHLEQVSEIMAGNDATLVLEADTLEIGYEESLKEAYSRSDELNQRRRELIVGVLATNGVPDAENRVVLEPVDRVGIRGIEAPGVFSRSISGGGIGGQGQNGGFGGGGFGGGLGGGFGGGIGGGGFGGGGGFF